MKLPLRDFGPTERFGFNPLNEFLTRPGETLIQASRRVGLFDIGELKQSNKTFATQNTAEPQTVKVPQGEPEIINPEVRLMINAMQRLGYRVAKNDSKDFNLNIVGIRNHKGTVNKFDDEMWVFWKFRNRWDIRKYKITTDPGITWLSNPLNAKGTAILKEGQYIGAYKLGRHRNVYEALVQAKPVTVIRDSNGDKTHDYHTGKEEIGFFGINIHRANANAASTEVNKWSAGCQVFADPRQYDEFMKLCKLSIAEWGNSFSYTLIRKSQTLV